MSLCAEVAVSPKGFGLDDALRAAPSIRVEFERVVPFHRWYGPSLWVTGVSRSECRQLLRSDSSVSLTEFLASEAEEHLVRLEWRGDMPVLDVLADAHATCLRGVGIPNTWHLSLRFPDRRRVADSYQQCAAHGIRLTVERIHSSGWPSTAPLESVLTPTQRETLRVAHELGYFNVPREVTLQELAAEFGVTDVAVSQRLRRGLDRLISINLA